MQSRQYIIAMLATTFLNLFNTQSTHAVSIIYETDIESHINFNKVPYREGNREGQSWVKEEEDVRVLQRGGTPGLRRLLQEPEFDVRKSLKTRQSKLYSNTGLSNLISIRFYK